jgi:hypothetical protein
MSTLIEDVGAVLATVAPPGGVWYQVNTAEPAVYPYIVFSDLVSPTNNSFDGASNMQNTLFQIDAFSRYASEAIALREAIQAALQASAIASIQTDQRSGYEDAVKAFRSSGDYSCWSTN